jgi:hypothetical protein
MEQNKQIVRVKYWGRSVCLLSRDKIVVDNATNLDKLLFTLTVYKDNLSKQRLGEVVRDLHRKLTNPTASFLLYRQEILRDAIVPYLQMIASRDRAEGLIKRTNAARYHQLETILHHLSPVSIDSTYSDMSSSGFRSDCDAPHPALTLLALEEVIDSISKEGNWFQSDLEGMLESAVERQWLPILTELKAQLTSIGGRLLLLGFADLVARPLLLLFPVYNLVTECTSLAQEMNLDDPIFPVASGSVTGLGAARRQRTQEQEPPKINVNVPKLCRAVFMSVAAWQLLRLVSLYSAIGQVLYSSCPFFSIFPFRYYCSLHRPV